MHTVHRGWQLRLHMSAVSKSLDMVWTKTIAAISLGEMKIKEEGTILKLN